MFFFASAAAHALWRGLCLFIERQSGPDRKAQQVISKFNAGLVNGGLFRLAGTHWRPVQREIGIGVQVLIRPPSPEREHHALARTAPDSAAVAADRQLLAGWTTTRGCGCRTAACSCCPHVRDIAYSPAVDARISRVINWRCLLRPARGAPMGDTRGGHESCGARAGGSGGDTDVRAPDHRSRCQTNHSQN